MSCKSSAFFGYEHPWGHAWHEGADSLRISLGQPFAKSSGELSGFCLIALDVKAKEFRIQSLSQSLGIPARSQLHRRIYHLPQNHFQDLCLSFPSFFNLVVLLSFCLCDAKRPEQTFTQNYEWCRCLTATPSNCVIFSNEFKASCLHQFIPVASKVYFRRDSVTKPNICSISRRGQQNG